MDGEQAREEGEREGCGCVSAPLQIGRDVMRTTILTASGAQVQELPTCKPLPGESSSARMCLR